MVKGSAKQEKQNYGVWCLTWWIDSANQRRIRKAYLTYMNCIPIANHGVFFVMLFFDFLQFSAQYNALTFSVDSAHYSRMFTIACVCMQGYLFQQLYC